MNKSINLKLVYLAQSATHRYQQQHDTSLDSDTATRRWEFYDKHTHKNTYNIIYGICVCFYGRQPFEHSTSSPVNQPFMQTNRQQANCVFLINKSTRHLHFLPHTHTLTSSLTHRHIETQVIENLAELFHKV